MRPTCRLLTVMLVPAAILAGAPAALAVTLTGTVTRVVDGDTIRVESRGFETPVRLIGIDTPESVNPRTGVECFGPEASARTKRLLPAGLRVRLVTDPTQDTRDRYARLLAYVYVGAKSGVDSVNHRLVREGYAEAYVYRASAPFRYAGPFEAAERAARRERRGMWARCAGSGGGGTTTPRGGGPVTRPGCDPNYTGACVPVTDADLDCADISGPVTVVGTDRHRFDGNGDGQGCEG